MTSSRKDIDLRKHREPDLVAALFHPTEDLRQAAFREICARGEKRGWEAFSFLTQDPELAGRFASIKDPFDAVGIAVAPETYDRIHAVWPKGVEQLGEGGRRELTIDFRNQRLDVMTIAAGAWPPGEKYPAGQEGFCEVEFRVRDVAAFARRVEELPPELKSRLVLLPADPVTAQSPGAGRWLLVHARAARGARTVLVQLVPA